MMHWQQNIIGLTCILLLAGCIYIPTAEHGLISGRAMITDHDIEELEPGITTRADFLLKFGDPGERLENDEIFCYEWERVQGVFGTMGAAADVGRLHVFCAQFSDENILLRAEEVEAFNNLDTLDKKEALG
ncbi:MAG: hypothetical protein QF790_04320 [Gammaproteobacteria bacterium]|nr:hypothetical protein [Gammaproteobacteria bacterium]